MEESKDSMFDDTYFEKLFNTKIGDPDTIHMSPDAYSLHSFLNGDILNKSEEFLVSDDKMIVSAINILFKYKINNIDDYIKKNNENLKYINLNNHLNYLIKNHKEKEALKLLNSE